NAHAPPPAAISSLGEPRQGWLTRLLTSANHDDDGAGVSLTPLAAIFVRGVLTINLVRALLLLIALLGLSSMAVEVLLALTSRSRQRRTLPCVPIPYLLVRANAPPISTASGRMTSTGTPAGDQFYRALQQAIPRPSWWGRLSGHAPWVAFTLTGLP